ncbi:MAG: response regulator transcription factor [Duncaniella sp.]|nr:response regulator transcription factor [Duncaniella sp.]
MRKDRIGILLSSALLSEGIASILHRCGALTVSHGPWTTSQNAPTIVITDPFMAEQCPPDSRKVCLLAGSLPPQRAIGFDEIISVYDTAEEICKKITALTSEPGPDPRSNGLSPREKDVILFVVNGLSNKEIAAKMNISVNTVMTHRRNIASKLKIHSPAGLTIFALATGLAKMDDFTG